MRATYFVLAAAILQGLLAAAPASALEDGHSLEAIREAVQSPIPQSAVEQARQIDDQILRTGTVNGTTVYLVTDERLQHVQALVHRVLVAIGENPQGWVVHVLDTDPKTPNAFVYGGKYIYVFTGLLNEVHGDNELAVVVGHEIGHSVLKHNIRANSDLTSTLVNLAVIFGQIKGGSGGSNAMAIGKALHNGYSRDDEREADAFGVLAAWRAGFDPIGGAGFFTRLGQQYGSQPITDHPANQERVAAIAAETDWVHGARTLGSMRSYPQAYNVIRALLDTNSPIFAGVRRTTGASGAADSSASSQSAAPAPVLTAQRDAQSDADAAAASAAAIEAERQRIAAARQHEQAVTYEKPRATRAMTAAERRESQF
jgi:predicted Zn-dependent protease